jgi:hypothetical protein
MNAMKTRLLPPCFLTLGLAVAALGVIAPPARGQIAPTVSIRGSVASPEFCPPNAGCVGINFQLTRTAPGLALPLTVRVGYSGTATPGVDYNALPDTVTFAPGAERVSLFSYAIDDTFVEGDETVEARLLFWNISADNQYRIDVSNALATVTIRDNDLPSIPIISIRAVVPETREPLCDPAICDAALPAPGVFVVSRVGGDPNSELTVFLRYAGTASSELDYRPPPGQVLFAAGVQTVELLVEASHDTLMEGDETAVAEVQPDPSLGPIERYRVDPAQSLAQVVIHDNDLPPSPIVSIEATGPIAEESSYPYRRLPLRGRFTITRTGLTDHALSVFVHYGGTATVNVDYPALPWLVSIPAGTNRVELEVVPNIDDKTEPIETVVAELSECPPLTEPALGIPCYAVNIDPAHASATVFIRDNGLPTATLEITAPKGGAEFSEGTPIRIAATAIDLEGAITHVEFFDGDEKIGESTINFFREPDPGTPIHHEFEWQGAAVGLHVLTVRGADSGGNPVTSAPVQIRVGLVLPIVSIHATVPETAEPSTTTPVQPGLFTLKRTGSASNLLRVWMHYSGTATAGLDYGAAPTMVEFPAGAASVEVLIVPIDDELAEGDETVVAMVTPSPLAILPTYEIDPANNRAQVIIHDSDISQIPLVSIRATRAETHELLCPPNTCLAPVPEPGVFAVSRSGGDWTHGLIVFLRSGGSALPKLDYDPLPESVEIPAGQESVELLINAHFDDLVEGDETVVAALQPDPSLGAIEHYRIDLTRATARIVIHDRTPPTSPVVTITAIDAFAREGGDSNTARNTATFLVNRAGPTNEPLSVAFSLGGTASNGVDYVGLTSPLLIPAGHRSARLIINPIDDLRVEPVETVVVTLLKNASDTTVLTYDSGSAYRAAAVIVDNDCPRPDCVRLSDGLFNLCVPSDSTDCFRIETTRDLKSWTPLCTLPVNEGAVQYVDPDSSDSPQQFYRWVPVACDPDE